MPSDSPQFDYRKITKWFAKDEVKTPLAFFFKVLPWLTGIWGLVLYAPIPSDVKVRLIIIATSVFGGMAVLIAVFAWFNPRHLIYGEAGHRAERKLEFGTERKTYTSEELNSLHSTSNPKQLEAGDIKEQS